MYIGKLKRVTYFPNKFAFIQVQLWERDLEFVKATCLLYTQNVIFVKNS